LGIQRIWEFRNLRSLGTWEWVMRQLDEVPARFQLCEQVKLLERNFHFMFVFVIFDIAALRGC
jgi:hypothetical protein